MEEAAFAALYEATFPALRAYVVKGVGEATVADDISQEAYVRLLQARTSGLGDPQLKAYLYRIATNLMHDHWRRSKREVHDDDAVRAQPDKTRDERVDLRLDVDEAFNKLSPGQRTLLWLAYVEGYGHRDIAGVMNLREKSVRVLLFRARNRLTGLLRRVGINGEDVR
jgi:RNA polymerase sigma-70 factor (ECF subfamily)